MTKTAWTDNNNYEGKALRRVFTKLLKHFEKEINTNNNNNNDDANLDLEKFQKIAHTLTVIAKTKFDMSYKETKIEDRIKLLEMIIPVDIKRKTIIAKTKERSNDLSFHFRN